MGGHTPVSYFQYLCLWTQTDYSPSVFILRPRATRASSATDVYLVDHVFPILDGFTISMAQSRRNTLNLTAVQALNQPRTGNALTFLYEDQDHSTVFHIIDIDFTLTIHPGHDPLLEPVNMVTHDTQRLRTLLAECRRLKEIASVYYKSCIVMHPLRFVDSFKL